MSQSIENLNQSGSNQSAKYDVIIIGGSYAGLSAAMALGRSLRKVLIIDSGKPCNRQTPHSHNFLTQDGSTPKEIAELGKEQVLAYSNVAFHKGLALKAVQHTDHFEITCSNQEIFKANKLILATGIQDEFPNIKGFAECWGITVVHCPYCHGYEFNGQPVAILSNGEKAFHVAGLVNNLNKELTLITSGKPSLSEEQLATLKRNNIQVNENEVEEIVHDIGVLKEVIFKDGSNIKVSALYAMLAFTQHSDIAQQLGCEITEHGYIKIDPFQKTTIPGVYACGDNSSGMRSVANAVYSGNLTGALVNKELTDDRF